MNKLIHHGILITALLAGTSIPLVAQQGQSENGMEGTNQWSDHHDRHHHWKAMREEMAAEIKTQDAELEQLAAQMSNAPPAQKADATAAVVGKLVEDRLALHQKLESMHERMHGTNEPTDTNSSTMPPTR